MIIPVAPWDVDRIWETVEPLLRRGFDRVEMQRYYPANYLLQSVKDGRKSLWVATDGAGVMAAFITEVLEYPTGRREMEIQLAGGERMKEWLPQAIPTFRRAAERAGCAAIVAKGRPGWAKIKGVNTTPRCEMEI